MAERVGRGVGFCVLLLLGVGTARGDDVVFAAARLRLANRSYYPIDSSHLYRIREDGTQLRLLTAGPDWDTDPCLSADSRRILFWRRNRDDLVGNVGLCSIAFDGSDFRTIRTFNDIKLPRPKDMAHLLTAGNRFMVHADSDSEEGVDLTVKLPSGELKVSTGAVVSPNGRYLRICGDYADEFVVDLQMGKKVPLAGIPSGAGGVSVPEHVCWLDENTLFYGFYSDNSYAAISSADGRTKERLTVFKDVKGRRLPGEIFDDTQWHSNPDGTKAYWYDTSHEKLLLQLVTRTPEGGEPAIYCIERATGLIRFQISAYFLEDVSKDGAHFLATTWKWGKGFGGDGTAPLRKLLIWDRRSLKPRQLGFDLAGCEGACFAPSGSPKQGISR